MIAAENRPDRASSGALVRTIRLMRYSMSGIMDGAAVASTGPLTPMPLLLELATLPECIRWAPFQTHHTADSEPQYKGEGGP
jgi:hypothetical protein